MAFTIVEHHELLALFRAIMEAKFQSEPEDDDLPASAVLAGITERLRDEIAAAEDARGGKEARDRWLAWDDIGPQRPEWAAALGYAARAWQDIWPTWSEEQKDHACYLLLSPFTVTSGSINKFKISLQTKLRE